MLNYNFLLSGGRGGIDFWWRGNKNLVGGIFARGGMSKFWLVRGTYTYVLYIYIYKRLCQQVFIYNDEAFCTSHTSCAEVAILLLQDLNTLCVTYIYIWYVFSLVYSVFVIRYIYHIMNMFNQPQWREKYLSKQFHEIYIYLKWMVKYI